MKVYIVFCESGSIHSIYKSKTDANKAKKDLAMRFDNATIKEFEVK